jgi:hypothetical protein
MKKIIISVSCLLMTTFAIAGGNKGKVEEDGVLSNGFYLNLGIGLPKSTILTYDGPSMSPFVTQKLGTQINLEVGNQWYFYTNDNIGIGLKASWLQFGFSKYSEINKYASKITFSNIDGYAFDLKLIKIAPMFSYAVNEDFAIDASFEVAPTVNYFQVQEAGYVGRNEKVGSVLFGATFAPGLRVRYSMFAIGFDYSFGTLVGTGTLPGATTDYGMTQKITNSRIYLGLQF